MSGFTEEPAAAFTAQTMPSPMTANDWIAPQRRGSALVRRPLVVLIRSLDPDRDTTAPPVVTAATASELDCLSADCLGGPDHHTSDPAHREPRQNHHDDERPRTWHVIG